MSLTTPHSNPASPARLTLASVADFHGQVLAMIYGHTEPASHNPDIAVFVISLKGEIDQDAAPYLDRVIAKAFTGGTVVCCDLSGATFFGTAGALVILDAVRHAKDENVPFVLRGVHGVAAQILEAIGIDHRIFNNS